MEIQKLPRVFVLLLSAHRVLHPLKMISYAKRLTAIALVSSCSIAIGQTSSANQPRAGQIVSEDIIDRLASGGVPPPDLKLRPTQKAEAIRLLKAAKRRDTGLRKQLAIYLLATLGQDYQLNRDDLLRIWNGCVVKDFNTGCDENTGDMLIKLYGQGHRELLRPILAGCHYSDGALSEELYPFYTDRLEHSPKEFVSFLASFPLNEQSDICIHVGGDVCEQTGGGPTNGTYPDALRTVLGNLKTTGDDVANRCSRAVRKGYRDGVAAILEEEKGPQAMRR
jgi:hypothetical protein